MREVFKALTLVAAVSFGFPAVSFAQAPTCAQTLTPGCLYFPSNQFSVQPTSGQVSYRDRAGLTRTIEFAIRKPVGAPVPLPVVIWSHGGAEGKTEPANSLSNWSEVTAAAGYLTISIAHTPRSNGERSQLCQALGIPVPDTCAVFKHLNWDRPFDIRAVTGDTDLTPVDLGSYSSRVTLMMGNAAIQAATRARDLIAGAVSRKLEIPVERLTFAGRRVFDRERATDARTERHGGVQGEDQRSLTERATPGRHDQERAAGPYGQCPVRVELPVVQGHRRNRQRLLQRLARERDQMVARGPLGSRERRADQGLLSLAELVPIARGLSEDHCRATTPRIAGR